MCHLVMVGSDVPSGDGGIRCAIWCWWDQMCHLVMVGSDVPSGDHGIRCAIW